MEITQAIFNIKRSVGKPHLAQSRNYLVDENLTLERKISYIGMAVDNDDRYKFRSVKHIIIPQAVDSGGEIFRLIATCNESIDVFNWCDTQQNFIGMCFKVYDDDDKDYTVEYSLDELPKAIANAERWLEGIKGMEAASGSPYFVSRLQLMKIK